MQQDESPQDSHIVETAKRPAVIHVFGFTGIESQPLHRTHDTTLCPFAVGRRSDFGKAFYYGYAPQKPFNSLRMAARNLADATMLIDPEDRVVRRYALALEYNQCVLPSLALSVLTRYFDVEPEWNAWVSFSTNDEQHFQIPIDRHAFGLVNFLHPVDLRYPNRIPFWRALALERSELSFVKDKIVIIGSTVGDFYETPVTRKYPGLLIHASMINSVLQQSVIRLGGWHSYALAMIAFIVTFLIANRLSFLGWKQILSLILVASFTFTVICVGLFLSGILVDVALINLTPLLALTGILVARRIWPVRTQVFISYSRRDRRWANELKTMLSPAVRKAKVTIYLDTDQNPGIDWEKELKKALKKTKVAVLLVSPDYLASDFIMTQELPHFLRAAEQKELSILWVPLRRSLYEETALSKLQALVDPSTPLENLAQEEQTRALVEISEKVIEAVES